MQIYRVILQYTLCTNYQCVRILCRTPRNAADSPPISTNEKSSAAAELFSFAEIPLNPSQLSLTAPVRGIPPSATLQSGVPAASTFFKSLADADDAALMRLLICPLNSSVSTFFVLYLLDLLCLNSKPRLWNRNLVGFYYDKEDFIAVGGVFYGCFLCFKCICADD